jgi:type II secretory pathway component GspD/PulD (secretin)
MIRIQGFQGSSDWKKYSMNDRLGNMKRLSLCRSTVVSLVFFAALSFADVVEIIQIHYRSAADALKIVENLLTKEGSATMDEHTNSLVVKDNEESVGRIMKIISNFDKAVEQAKIRVRFNENESDSGRLISAGGYVRGKNWAISSGKKKKDVEVSVEDIDKSRQTGSEYFINVASGSPAYIVTGKSIPYREKWIRLTGRRAVAGESVHFENIETGFEVTPVITGDHADIRITPRISGGGDKGGIIRFAEAATSLRVPLGKWVTIGGADQKENEVLNALFERGDGTKSASFSVSIMVER